MRIFIFFVFLGFFVNCYAIEPVKVAMDVESSAGEGEVSLENIAKIAQSLGIDAVIIGEQYCARFEYGIGPLRRIFRKTYLGDSACKYGLERYLRLFDEINKNSKVLMIEGFEAAPYYWWRGSFFKGDLQLVDWHRQFIVTGLDLYGYRDLPVTSTGKSKYSPYDAKKWLEPYQDFVDYVQQRGGLVFWAHPDEGHSEKIRGITVSTQPYPEMLKRIDGFTGFGIFFGGYEETGRLGGIWDQILLEYCSGRRKYPVWAIGELDYSSSKEIGRIDEMLNFVFVEQKTRKDVLSAMKKGRLYVSWGMHRKGIFLGEWFLRDVSNKEKAYAGETLFCGPKVQLVLSLRFEKKLDSVLTINILKNAQLFDIKEVTKINGKEAEITIEDNLEPGQNGYFRIEAKCRGAQLITNPIFYKYENKK
ncbi:MAG: hypothetical protein HZC15_02290 [Candidatus Omnitrophica bacterium]|nr:hypothetical protein [Candidatus Omnitrophota bacterium]